MYLHTRSDGKLFNLARLRAKTKGTDVYVREMLFADDASLTAHSGKPSRGWSIALPAESLYSLSPFRWTLR